MDINSQIKQLLVQALALKQDPQAAQGVYSMAAANGDIEMMELITECQDINFSDEVRATLRATTRICGNIVGVLDRITEDTPEEEVTQLVEQSMEMVIQELQGRDQEAIADQAQAATDMMLKKLQIH
jgi:hypothetical protein